ncbi:MAG: hypothetical protein KDB39_18610, partial [Austwickia sp.]|nr:hypothetical protein [Austwickia sp.]
MTAPPGRTRRLRTWPLLVSLWLGAAVGTAVVAGTVASPLPTVDVAAANDLVRTAERTWPELDRAALDRAGPDYTVVDGQGRVLASRGAPVTDQLAAVRARAAALDVMRDGAVVGRVFVADPTAAAVNVRADRIARVAAGTMAALAVLATAWVWWLRRRVVTPFARLQEFAADVAAGRLDAPLRMDRSHLFGAFSESFDVLRAQLTRAREAERAATDSKRALVSQLGHDIRTPLASIGATAELLAVGEEDAVRRERLSVVLAKVAQIDALVEELFEANAEQLEALPVEPEPHPAAALADLVRRADVTGIVAAVELAEGLIELDPRR